MALMDDLLTKKTPLEEPPANNNYTGRGCRKFHYDGYAFNKPELARYLGVTHNHLRNQLYKHRNDLNLVINNILRQQKEGS